MRIDFSANNLTEIPLTLAGLPNVEEINFENNQIELVPDVLDALTKIKVLKLANNRIAAFPSSILLKTSVTAIYLEGNPISRAQFHSTPGYEEVGGRDSYIIFSHQNLLTRVSSTSTLREGKGRSISYCGNLIQTHSATRYQVMTDRSKEKSEIYFEYALIII